MKLLLVCLLLMSCDVATTDDVYRIVAAETEVETEIVEDSEPEWTPEKLTLYIFDSADEIVYQQTTTADMYSSKVKLYKLTVETHNRDFPADLWYFIGGGM